MKIKFFRSPFRKFFRRDSRARRAVGALVVFSFTLNALANPTGMTVAGGRATATASGSQLTVTTGSPLTLLNWQSFNIGAGESTVFNQPTASSVVINRINGNSGVSQIYGSLQANGVVVLLNSSGFYFGPNSFVSAAGLMVSTANCVPPQNAGGSWVFNGPPPLASIVNYGQIKIGNGGDCYFIADKVENHGTVEAPGGNIGFAAGQTVTLSERPDGRGMSMQVTLPQGSVDNYGNVIADGGTIALHANVVNQGGLLQANSVRDVNGTIELVAGDTLNLDASSQISAQGDDASGGSAGGNVTLQAGNNFSDTAGSTISTKGGAQGGNGGNVEVSAPNILSLASAMDAGAQAGWIGGEFLLDPVNIVLGTSGNGTVPNNGTVAYNSGSGTLSLNVNTAFANKNFSNIKLQATGNITVNAGTVWDLSGSTGQTSGQLTLQAGGNIILNNGAEIVDANNWSVSLQAGYDFVNKAVKSGVGSISFYDATGQIFASNGDAPSAMIQMAGGDVSLVAGQNITLGSGVINTTAGGNISLHALAGNIDTGSYAQGYLFQAAGSASGGYLIGPGIGGVSTLAGGNVTLMAGGNISSVLPADNGYYYGADYGNGNFLATGVTDGTAGSGAYGPEAGNVTVVAGRNVTGHYLVANGTGSIYAGVLMDANGNPVMNAGKYVLGNSGSAGTDSGNPNFALSLINGGWNVTAAQNIILQEVRNPNGVFNNQAGGANHAFDYGLNDFVNLDAGYACQLGASSSLVPRQSGDTETVPFIYPSILNVTAGAGGVALVGDTSLNQLILYPSPAGSLVINTTGGGNLTGSSGSVGGAPSIFDLVVSDGDASQYNQNTTLATVFGLSGHAATPVHLGNPTPVELNISGDMDQVFLSSPEAAQINVVGNMNNCRFQAMNLNASDTSSITVGQAAKANMESSGILNPATDGGLTVGGNIVNRSGFTSVDLTALSQQPGWLAPDVSVLAQAVGSPVSPVTLATSIYYNPATHVLTYQDIPGFSLSTVLQLLQNLTVQVYKNGVPQWVDPQQTIPLTEKVSVINAATAQALTDQYAALGGAAPSSTYGYTIGGGGKFDIVANNVDLGTTVGIRSLGVAYDQIGSSYPLAKLFANGADISVACAGNLTMYSSTIASLNGGNVDIVANGDISVGSSLFTINSALARGIYSTRGGNVSVISGGDVNVNGSRIGTYDGGNVTVESLFGNVNAGTGASTPVTVTAYYVNPVTHQVYQSNPQLPFSGIIALTFPPRDGTYPAPGAQLGSILIEAPNGDVNANTSGILQLALNGQGYPNAFVTVSAGCLLHDAADQAVTVSDANRPIIQGGLQPAPAGSAPRTVLVGSQSVTVSLAVWNQLITLLGVNPAPGQTLQMNIGTSHQTDLINVLTVNPAGLAAFNFATLESPNHNINANGSGLIASNAKLVASGSVNGLIFADHNIDVLTVNNVNITALGGGQVSADSSSGNITGTLIGGTGVSVSGAEVSAALISDSVSGGTSGQTGLGTGGAANATANAASASADASADKTTTASAGDEDVANKKKGISLAQKVSRVTVLLPATKKMSQVNDHQPKI
jgi:filamentous hemagglutinin family protein